MTMITMAMKMMTMTTANNDDDDDDNSWCHESSISEHLLMRL